MSSPIRPINIHIVSGKRQNYIRIRNNGTNRSKKQQIQRKKKTKCKSNIPKIQKNYIIGANTGQILSSPCLQGNGDVDDDDEKYCICSYDEREQSIIIHLILIYIHTSYV